MAEDRLNQLYRDLGKLGTRFTVFFLVVMLVFLIGSRAHLPIVMLPSFLALVAGEVIYFRKRWQIEKDSSVKTVKYELAAIAFVLAAIGLALAISLLLFVLV